jgi:hypothetical protein
VAALVSPSIVRTIAAIALIVGVTRVASIAPPIVPAIGMAIEEHAVQNNSLTSVGESITNADVLRLVAEGVAEDVIIETIRLRGAGLDLHARELISLRERGVSRAIVAAMLARKIRQKTPSPAPLTATALGAPIPRARGASVDVEPRSAPVAPVAPTPVHAEPPKAAVTSFELSVFRGTRRLLISANRIEYEAKDTQGRVKSDSFIATCDDVMERKPGRFERSLQVRLKNGRRYTFDINKEVLAAVMAALTKACG